MDINKQKDLIERLFYIYYDLYRILVDKYKEDKSDDIVFRLKVLKGVLCSLAYVLDIEVANKDVFYNNIIKMINNEGDIIDDTSSDVTNFEIVKK